MTSTVPDEGRLLPPTQLDRFRAPPRHGTLPGLLGGFGFLLLVACTPGPPLAEEDSRALADTLTALIQDAYDFSRSGTLDRMIALYADTDGVISASGGQITVSADSVREGIRRFWELAGQNMGNARWIWGEVHVDRLSGDAAVLTATWTIPHTAPDGEAHVLEGAWTAVFRRVAGNWKIVHEHLSAPS